MSFLSLNTQASGAGRPSDIPELTEEKAVLPFYLKNAPVRGRFVRLGALGDALLKRHPEASAPALGLMGKMAALTAGLAASLKFEGSFTLQTRGEGSIALMASDCTHGGALRVTVQEKTLKEEKGTKLSQEGVKAGALLGAGYLAFTIQEKQAAHPHQGIVQMAGNPEESLAEIAERYFKESAQYPCHILLFSKKIAEKWHCAALILERLPDDSQTRTAKDASQSAEDVQELWQTSVTLADTLTEEEALEETLTPEALLYRLFGSLDVVAAPYKSLSFGCRCTRQKIETMLKGFQGADREDLLHEGKIEVDCHFCNIRFSFLPQELGL